MVQVAKNYAYENNEDPPVCLGSQEPAYFLSFNLSSQSQLQDAEMLYQTKKIKQPTAFST